LTHSGRWASLDGDDKTC